MHALNRALTAIAVVALLGGVAACSPQNGSTGGQDDTLILGKVNPAEIDFNPVNNISIVSWDTQLVYDWILRPADRPDGSAERDFLPGLATEWEFNDDATVFTMKVRQGVTFADGTELTSQNFRDLLDAMTFSDNFSNSLRTFPITEITAVDDETIVFTFSEPIVRSWFLAIMGESGVASPGAILDAAGIESLSKTPVGSGPYTYAEDESSPGAEYVFHKNDDHWDADSYPFANIVMKLYPDTVSMLNALKSGQIEFMQVDAATRAAAEDGGFEIFEWGGPWAALVLANRVSGPLSDVRVRQAINYALDREAIVATVLSGYGKPSTQIFNTGQDEFVVDGNDDYPFDPDRARELMAEAGYADGFELKIPAVGGFGAEYEPVMQQLLGDIGITVTLVPLADFGEWLAKVQGKELDAFFFQHDFVSSVASHIEEAPQGIVNAFPLPDEEIRELLKTRRVGNDEERAEASQAIGQYVLDNAWFAVLAQPSVMFAAVPGLEVDSRGATGQPPFIQGIRPAD